MRALQLERRKLAATLTTDRLRLLIADIREDVAWMPSPMPSLHVAVYLAALKLRAA